MPAIKSLKPVTPRTAAKLPAKGSQLLKDALEYAKSGHDRKAARLFDELVKIMEALGSPDMVADSAAMRANASLMTAKIEMGRDEQQAEKLLGDTMRFLEKALAPDRYWADYLFLKDHIYHALHKEIGCRITRRPDGAWPVECVAVSKALGIPRLSRGEKFDLECSICSQDPMFCPHIAGQVYNGRLALEVVKNLEFTHISILIDQIPEDPNMGILPRPLNDTDIKRFFPKGKANQILLRGELRCGDLIRVIKQEGLGGADFVPPSLGRA